MAIAEITPAAEVAVPVLIRALKDEWKWERAHVVAAESLGRIGPAARSAVPALKEFLKDKDGDVRKAAAEALKKIQPAPAHRAGKRKAKR